MKKLKKVYQLMKTQRIQGGKGQWNLNNNFLKYLNVLKDRIG